MIAYIKSSRCSLTAVAALVLAFCSSAAYAESKAFKGTSTTITIDKSCKNKPDLFEIILVFDGPTESALSGWFYGKGTSTAEFRRVSPTNFEVIYPTTRYKKQPPSHLTLTPSEKGFLAVIRDHIPEEKTVRESECFFEKVEVTLKPTTDDGNDLMVRAREHFTSELLLTEGSDLLWNINDYRSAEEKGHKSLLIMEGIYGKYSEKTLDSSAIITFALMRLERFDEALAVIEPYLQSLPDNADIKELVGILRAAKKEQDELFRSDPDSEGAVAFGPIG